MVAQAAIAEERKQLEARIESMTIVRNNLSLLIVTEKARLDSLIQERAEIIAVADSLGITVGVRLSEREQIMASIQELAARGTVLFQEKIALEGITNASASAVVALASLASGIMRLTTIPLPLPPPLPPPPPSPSPVENEEIEWLARGGIVTRPTTVRLAELGAEAVIPLDQGFGARIGITINALDPRGMEEVVRTRIIPLLRDELNSNRGAARTQLRNALKVD